jgi:hypothetical protein
LLKLDFEAFEQLTTAFFEPSPVTETRLEAAKRSTFPAESLSSASDLSISQRIEASQFIATLWMAVGRNSESGMWANVGQKM